MGKTGDQSSRSVSSGEAAAKSPFGEQDSGVIILGYKSPRQVEEIVKARLARERKARERAVKEAKRLAKAEAEAFYRQEHTRLRQENETLRRAWDFIALSEETAQALTARGINPGADLLAMLTKDTPESTKNAVSTFAAALHKTVQATNEIDWKRVGGRRRLPSKVRVRVKTAQRGESPAAHLK